VRAWGGWVFEWMKALRQNQRPPTNKIDDYFFVAIFYSTSKQKSDLV
jgi:hypothetical protein